MHIKAVKRGESQTLYIVQSVRVAPKDGGKVKVPRHKYLKAIGTARGAKALASLRRRAKKELASLQKESAPVAKKSPTPKGLKAVELEATEDVITGIYDIYGKVYDDLGLDKIIHGSSNDDKFNKIIKALVLSRIAHPDCSKVEIAKKLADDYNIDFPLHKYYQAMDKLVEVKDEVMRLVFAESKRWHNAEIKNLLIDVTTT